jgi:hypothetical protein
MNHSETKKLVVTTGVLSANVFAERVSLVNEAGQQISTKTDAELNSRYLAQVETVLAPWYQAVAGRDGSQANADQCQRLALVGVRASDEGRCSSGTDRTALPRPVGANANRGRRHVKPLRRQRHPPEQQGPRYDRRCRGPAVDPSLTPHLLSRIQHATFANYSYF